MGGDIFGNLREWGQVPEQITELRATGRLDEHQAGLVRLLRYRDNWRLREMVLKSMKDLSAPSDELISEVLGLLADEGLYYEARILAAQALADLLTTKGVEYAGDRDAVLSRIVEKMRAVAESSGPPVLRGAILECLTAFENAR